MIRRRTRFSNEAEQTVDLETHLWTKVPFLRSIGYPRVLHVSGRIRFRSGLLQTVLFSLSMYFHLVFSIDHDRLGFFFFKIYLFERQERSPTQRVLTQLSPRALAGVTLCNVRAHGVLSFWALEVFQHRQEGHGGPQTGEQYRVGDLYFYQLLKSPMSLELNN